mmetsp:Transcript_6519/g.17451  ORF Transcript_6519/g.17451 Transcript_6519/m.17451 type:complete len:424 (+) Transcript_6519:41-1312(+)
MASTAAAAAPSHAVHAGAAAGAGLIPLRVCAQNYAWGQIGVESLVAQVYARNASASLDASAPYAELWIGDHPKGEATTVADATPLSALLERCNWDLPYLLKILSVKGALSIQAHPDKALAAKLHAADSKNYPDENHKPEMSVALSPFRAMCGFRSLDLIAQDLARCSELAALVGSDICDAVSRAADASSSRAALRALFEKLMTQSTAAVESSLSALKDRLESSCASGQSPQQDELFLSLYEQYPGDVGCFAAFLLNYVSLQPGEAFFMAANEPHAYLSGECVEIMARSDNVVRAGLTPKFKDVETLLNMLTYESGPPAFIAKESMGPFVSRYIPPALEFQLTSVELPASTEAARSVVLERARGVGMFLVVRGTGWISAEKSGKDTLWPLHPGAVYLIPPEMTLTISSGNADLLAFVSGINGSV